MSRVCQITGKKMITGNNVSHSKKRTRRKFYPNLFDKKFYLSEEGRWVNLKVSAKGMRIINKKGLGPALVEAKEKGFLANY
jgi:large subunit ribosomal protein L28